MMVVRNERLRRFLRFALPFCVIPAVVALGVLGGEKYYAIVILIITIITLLLFAAGFEKKRTGTRRLVLCAVLTALSVAGRFIPVFKPVTAMVTLTGVYLGGESGFLVGAMSAVISNFYFGQGPWTPFQMLAWGLIGLFAGLLGRWLKKSRVLLGGYGVLSGIAFSLAMDIWSLLWMGSGNAGGYLSLIKTALPFTAIYCVSNVVFLLLIAPGFGKKLERINTKYGI